MSNVLLPLQAVPQYYVAAGKKKTKSKGKTQSLTEFLQNEDGSVPTPVTTSSSSSWAAEMENADVDGESGTGRAGHWTECLVLCVRHWWWGD